MRSITMGIKRLAPVLVALAAGAALAGAPARAAHRASAHPWPPLATASDFLVLEIRHKEQGRWDEVWQSLYPAHRRVASRWQYVRCEEATPLPTELQSLRIVSVRRARVRVPGPGLTVPGVAVRAHVELAWFGPRDPIVVTHTFHLVPVGGHWTWLLSPDRYRLYRDDACGFHPAV